MLTWTKNIALILLLSISYSGTGQTYGNEWIDYGQQYFSFKVYPDNPIPNNFGDLSGVSSGIYMLDYNTITREFH